MKSLEKNISLRVVRGVDGSVGGWEIVRVTDRDGCCAAWSRSGHLAEVKSLEGTKVMLGSRG
jgi:hypothetical protein